MTKHVKIILLILIITAYAPQNGYGCSSTDIGFYQDGLCFLGAKWGMDRDSVVKKLEENNAWHVRMPKAEVGLIKGKREILKEALVSKGTINNNVNLDFIITRENNCNTVISYKFSGESLVCIFLITFFDKLNNRGNSPDMDYYIDLAAAIYTKLGGGADKHEYVDRVGLYINKAHSYSSIYKIKDTFSMMISGVVLWSKDYNITAPEIEKEYSRVKRTYEKTNSGTNNSKLNTGKIPEVKIDLRLKERKDTVDSLLN